MTPLRRLHVGVLATVLVTALGTAGLRTLNDADPLSVADAVERFREQQPASPRPAPGSRTPTPPAAGRATPSGARQTAGATAAPHVPRGSGAPGRSTAPPARPGTAGDLLPPEGVYVYTSTGYETGAAGPMTARHDYPAETTMTITRDGCGSSMRWEPVEGRWDDVIDCVSGRTSKIRVYDTMHEFFGVTERHTYRCGGDSWFRPPSVTPGYRWEFRCASPSAQTHTVARVVGVERVSVGDYTGDAVHIRFDTTMTGRTEGTNPSDFWLALHEPFLVRRVARVDAKVHSDFGTLDYHEEYEVRLTSRRPRT